jgi:four helix bundle protein
MVREMDYRKMRAYQLARDFYVCVAQHARRAGWRDNALMDQLMRASSSICLNIAEGAGEYSRAEKNRFYRIARRSAWESSSAVDLISQMTHCPDLVDSSMKLDQVSALLTTMILRSEQGEG